MATEVTWGDIILIWVWVGALMFVGYLIQVLGRIIRSEVQNVCGGGKEVVGKNKKEASLHNGQSGK